MNILFTSNRFYPAIGGIETISDLLARYFVSAGHSVRVVTQTPSGESLETPLFEFSVIRRPSASGLLACFRWADIVFQNNIEVRSLWPLLLCRRPLVIGLQTWIRSAHGRRGGLHRLKKLILEVADQVIACSEAVRRDSCSRAIVIGNPYNSDLFRVLAGVSRCKPIVYLGRLVSDKGVDVLLNALARFPQPRPRLTIIGSGPEEASLRLQARDLDMADSVTFLGPMKGEALVQELNAHEVMVVPSLWEEPFGVVALEGLACGCVVLASDGGGLPDAVGPAGLLFRRGDSDDLYCKLNDLLSDARLRSRLQACSADHLAPFRQDVVSERYLTILEDVFHACRAGHT